MTLQHLFGLIGYDPNDDDWWELYKQLHNPTRQRHVIYEDWKHRNGLNRGKMWSKQIDIAEDEYTDEQRTAFAQARADIDTIATQLNITLPATQVAPNPLPAMSVATALPATSVTNALPTTAAIFALPAMPASNSLQTTPATDLMPVPAFVTAYLNSSRLPNTSIAANSRPYASFTAPAARGNTVASDGEARTAQQVHAGTAASASKKRRASVGVLALQPLLPTPTPAKEP